MGPSQEKIDALERKMKRLNILRTDIEEKFIKAGGRAARKLTSRTVRSIYFIKKPI